MFSLILLLLKSKIFSLFSGCLKYLVILKRGEAGILCRDYSRGGWVTCAGPLELGVPTCLFCDLPQLGELGTAGSRSIYRGENRSLERWRDFPKVTHSGELGCIPLTSAVFLHLPIRVDNQRPKNLERRPPALL